MKSSILPNKNISFKSHDFKTTSVNKAGEVKVYNHYTYPGRDIEDTFLLNNLMQDHFRKGATIVNYGTSTGAEAYDLTLINHFSPKYPIIAFDASPEAIALAKEGVFPIARNKIEGDVVNFDYYLNKQNSPKRIANAMERVFKNLFNTYYQETNCPNQNGKTKAALYDCYEASEQLKQNISFNVGDIENMDELKLKELDPPPGVFIFKNSWSYLFNNEKGEVRIDNNAKEVFAKIEAVIGKISDLLPQKGLFSIGDCPYDHIVLDKENKVITPPPLVKMLQEQGFGPVQRSMKKITLNGFVENIPTIWKKL